MRILALVALGMLVAGAVVGNTLLWVGGLVALVAFAVLYLIIVAVFAASVKVVEAASRPKAAGIRPRSEFRGRVGR